MTPKQATLFTGPEKPPKKPFAGVTYDPALDHERLSRQLGRVYEALSAGLWMTLHEIYWECHRAGGRDSEAGISARLRDLRKKAFGGYEIERRRAAGGLWQYRMTGRRT